MALDGSEGSGLQCGVREWAENERVFIADSATKTASKTPTLRDGLQ